MVGLKLSCRADPSPSNVKHHLAINAYDNHHVNSIISLQGKSINTMSATQLLQPRPDVLQDYAIFHSNHDEQYQKLRNKTIAEGLSSKTTASAHQNPAGWNLNHRRLPDYRPINYDLDRAYIGTAQNTIEYILINIMFHGVNINAVSLHFLLLLQFLING